MPPARTNRLALRSFGLAVVAGVLSLALLPLLWASAIGIVLAMAALAMGVTSLRQIDSSTQTGHAFAWTGIVVATALLLLTAPAILMSFAPRSIDADNPSGPAHVPTCVGVSC